MRQSNSCAERDYAGGKKTGYELYIYIYLLAAGADAEVPDGMLTRFSHTKQPVRWKWNFSNVMCVAWIFAL